jgi:hypothetical protein
LNSSRKSSNLLCCSVNFSQLPADALAYSKRNKRLIRRTCAFYEAEGVVRLSPCRRIDAKRDRTRPGTGSGKGAMGTINIQLLSLADVAKLSPRDSESKSYVQSRAFRGAPSRGQQPRAVSDGRRGREAPQGHRIDVVLAPCRVGSGNQHRIAERQSVQPDVGHGRL